MPRIGDPTPAWLKPENASVLDSPMTKALRKLATLIGANDPQSQVLALMNPLVPEGQATLSAPLQAIAKKIRAFHGSPHDFDRFSLSKIGTGEGAQAYGHGLYFAENEGVARAYREKLAQPNVTDVRVQTLLDEHGGNLDAALDQFMRSVYDTPKAKAKMRADLMARYSKQPPTGRMYEVEINADPDTLLDWDKPLSQQSEHVQSAGRRLIDKAKQDAASNKRYAAQALLESPEYTPADPTGADLHRILSRTMNNDAQFNQTTVANALRAEGVPGLKYLDGGSRGAGAGTRNYVIFDDSLVSILKKYGVALPMIEGLRRKAQANNGRLPASDVEGLIQQ